MFTNWAGQLRILIRHSKHGMRLPILAGPLRGSWWLLEARGQQGRVLTGSYEPAQTEALRGALEPGMTVYDVGAHIGYYTLLFARQVGRSGRVASFEPDARNFHYLKRHLAINRVGHVDARKVAVSDQTGSARFKLGTGSGTGGLAADGSISVTTITLDSYWSETGDRPGLLKIDVEGAEEAVLRGASRLLREARPLIALSTHGPEVHRRCIDLLKALDYQVTPIGASSLDAATEVLARPTGG